MELPQHILVATDFSEASHGALDAAARFATACGARVTLVHVFDPTPMVPPAAIPAPQRMEEQIENEMSERIRQELDKLRQDRLGQVGNVEVRALREANPALAICEQATKDGADLIIVGTHGRTGVTHMVIGSVAERIVRHAPCPVLTVREKKNP